MRWKWKEEEKGGRGEESKLRERCDGDGGRRMRNMMRRRMDGSKSVDEEKRG